LFQALRHPRKVGAVLPSSNRLGIAMARALEDSMRKPSMCEPTDAFSAESSCGVGQIANGHANGNLPDSLEPLQVVELGPGTGQITKHLRADHLTLVEINRKFSELLAKAYPGATVFNGSAVEFFSQAACPCAVVSSIPMLNNPEAGAIREAVAQAYEAGLIKKLITFSYGSHSPFAGCGFASEKQVRFVAFNVPPARVWLYA
jgi:phospholipid N-methyltransferase